MLESILSVNYTYAVYRAKNNVREQGGKITDEYRLIKGFRAEFPEGTAHTLETNEHLDVENDGEVRTQ